MLLSNLIVLPCLAPAVLALRPEIKWVSPKPPSQLSHHEASHENASPGGGAACADVTQPTVAAPLSNIFAGLTNDEAASVTAFLHQQKALNLTANVNATE